MRILTYGTFDLLHVGHIRLFERLRASGEWLAVGISTDEFNAVKGKVALQPFEDRLRTVLASGLVDHVFPEEHWEQKPSDIRRLEIDVFAMGDDWSGRFDELAAYGVEVRYLSRTPGIDSTTIRSGLRLEGCDTAVLQDTLRIAEQNSAAETGN